MSPKFKCAYFDPKTGAPRIRDRPPKGRGCHRSSSECRFVHPDCPNWTSAYSTNKLLGRTPPPSENGDRDEFLKSGQETTAPPHAPASSPTRSEAMPQAALTLPNRSWQSPIPTVAKQSETRDPRHPMPPHEPSAAQGSSEAGASSIQPLVERIKKLADIVSTNIEFRGRKEELRRREAVATFYDTLPLDSAARKAHSESLELLNGEVEKMQSDMTALARELLELGDGWLFGDMKPTGGGGSSSSNNNIADIEAIKTVLDDMAKQLAELRSKNEKHDEWLVRLTKSISIALEKQNQVEEGPPRKRRRIESDGREIEEDIDEATAREIKELSDKVESLEASMANVQTTFDEAVDGLTGMLATQETLQEQIRRVEAAQENWVPGMTEDETTRIDEKFDAIGSEVARKCDELNAQLQAILGDMETMIAWRKTAGDNFDNMEESRKALEEENKRLAAENEELKARLAHVEKMQEQAGGQINAIAETLDSMADPQSLNSSSQTIVERVIAQIKQELDRHLPEIMIQQERNLMQILLPTINPCLVMVEEVFKYVRKFYPAGEFAGLVAYSGPSTPVTSGGPQTPSTSTMNGLGTGSLSMPGQMHPLRSQGVARQSVQPPLLGQAYNTHQIPPASAATSFTAIQSPTTMGFGAPQRSMQQAHAQAMHFQQQPATVQVQHAQAQHLETHMTAPPPYAGQQQ